MVIYVGRSQNDQVESSTMHRIPLQHHLNYRLEGNYKCAVVVYWINYCHGNINVYWPPATKEDNAEHACADNEAKNYPDNHREYHALLQEVSLRENSARRQQGTCKNNQSCNLEDFAVYVERGNYSIYTRIAKPFDLVEVIYWFTEHLIESPYKLTKVDIKG